MLFKVLVDSRTRWFEFMIFIQGLIIITWMQVRRGFGLNRDNWFFQWITICYCHNLQQLDFWPSQEKYNGYLTELEFYTSISYCLTDSPTRYMASNFGLGLLWTLSYVLYLGPRLWTWFDVTHWFFEHDIWHFD